MKRLIVILACMLYGFQAGAQRNEWQDPGVNHVGRMPMHANFFAYESADAAAVGNKALSERYMSLNGAWKFNWASRPEQRPANFFRTDFSDAAWGEMPVPGMWELNGYGNPMYLNVGYPWREQFVNDPPRLPDEGNHVGSYRRWIEIPAAWSGKQVIAHFGSVTSNIYLWVNGRYVGYSEDSKLEAEFDLTPHIKTGKNLIAFQVFRWCDGTYLEDQDFFRFAGVGRDCFLYARDKRHIADLRLDASLTDDYMRGRIDVTATLSPQARGCVLELVVADGEGAILTSNNAKISKKEEMWRLDAGVVSPWSAETPNLYTVTATLKSPSGAVLEVVPVKTGFRNVDIDRGLLLVNGRPITVKGVNRHEMDPDMGYVVSEERMLQDIRILKENNFNAVRTCHYPDNNRWYELCDQYGLYLVAEANVESHGMRYGEATLAKNPAYALAHLERNQRNVRRSINHPSVIVWSLGNEAGDGPNFEACYKWIKAYDPSRPVQYEHSVRTAGTPNTDIICPMYWDYAQCEKYLSENPDKPLIQCEYAHTMGNSAGGFGEYWDLIRKYPMYQGGFIWDFVAQAMRKTGKNGAMIYGYGGDWNPYDASDGNFSDNGIVNPDRMANPHLHEIKYVQQPVWIEDADVKNGIVSLFNEYDFRDLSNYYMEWSVLCDGRQVYAGIVTDIDAKPGEKILIRLPYGGSPLPAQGELLLNTSLKLKSPEPLLEAGHVVAARQLAIREYDAGKPEVAVRYADRYTSLGELRVRENDRNFVIVEGAGVRIDFDRRSGFITRYDVGPMAYLQEGAALLPNFWRAPTDNDFGAKLQLKNRVWDHPEMKLTALEARMDGGIAVIGASYDLPGIPAALAIEYRIDNAGEVLVRQKMKAAAGATVPDLMRFGMRMEMPAQFDRIQYYGRGPWENYTDRKRSAFVGIYSQTVDEQFHPYIRPQETGAKSDVRWWHQGDLGGRGLTFTASEPFIASALHYSQENLDDGLEKHQRHSPELAKQDGVFLCIDKAQYGLGCINSWGALPMEQYRLPYGDYTFEFRMTPERKLF